MASLAMLEEYPYGGQLPGRTARSRNSGSAPSYVSIGMNIAGGASKAGLDGSPAYADLLIDGSEACFRPDFTSTEDCTQAMDDSVWLSPIEEDGPEITCVDPWFTWREPSPKEVDPYENSRLNSLAAIKASRFDFAPSPAEITPPESPRPETPRPTSPAQEGGAEPQHQEPMLEMPQSSANGHASTPSPAPRRRRRRQNFKDADERDTEAQAKRARFLERNRLAANRCRQKQRARVTELEARAKDLTDQRNYLVACIASLKEERILLKDTLLRHTDCDCVVIREYLRREAERLEPCSVDWN